jgi:hypothetical protein
LAAALIDVNIMIVRDVTLLAVPNDVPIAIDGNLPLPYYHAILAVTSSVT